MEFKLKSIDSVKSQIAEQKAKIVAKQEVVLNEIEQIEQQYIYLTEEMEKVESEINQYRERVATQSALEDSKKRTGFISKFFSSDDQAKLLKLYERKQLIEFEMKEVQRLRTTGYTDKAKAELKALVELSLEETTLHNQFTAKELDNVDRLIKELQEYQRQLRTICYHPFTTEERQTVALASEIAIECPEKVLKDITSFGGLHKLEQYI